MIGVLDNRVPLKPVLEVGAEIKRVYSPANYKAAI